MQKVTRQFYLPTILILTAALLMPAERACAVEDDYALWLSVLKNGRLGHSGASSWRYMVQADYRLFNALEGTRQATGRTGIGYRLPRGFSVWLRYDYQYTQAREAGSIRQNRLQQVVNWAGDGPGITTLKFRGILEERRVENLDGTSLRLRLRAGVEWPMKSRAGANWIASFESFYDLRTLAWVDEGWNQNRAFFGASLPLPGTGHLELGYMNQWGNPLGDRDLMSHTLLLQYRF